MKRHYTNKTILKHGFNLKKLYINFDFATSHSTGFYIKNTTFKSLNYFNTKYKCSADYDLYYRLMLTLKKMEPSQIKINSLELLNQVDFLVN